MEDKDQQSVINETSQNAKQKIFVIKVEISVHFNNNYP